MTIVWAAIAVAGLVCVVAWSWYRRSQDRDLGVVSHQWLAEQRQRSDSVIQR
jgi:type VI protein secretion system component VasF